MGKWLAGAGLVLVALVALLWYQIKSPAAAPSDGEHAAPVQAAAAQVAAPTQVKAPVVAPHPAVQPGKIDPATDAFFYKFDDLVVPNATRAAAPCYTGGLERVHRNAKLKLAYKVKIKNGEVTYSDVKIVDNTINNPKMEACMMKAIAGVHWHDDELPDWEQDDSVVIRPERGMKKYTKENMDYDGSGPIGAAVMKAGDAPPPSDDGP
jgi:hypothetical protein